jgi:hypothetical protein
MLYLHRVQSAKLNFEIVIFQDLIAIHNAENWLGMDGNSELSMFNKETNGNGNEKLMLDAADNINVAPRKSNDFETK